jgi:predicted lipid-binding transport protein (Tim44 family)
MADVEDQQEKNPEEDFLEAERFQEDQPFEGEAPPPEIGGALEAESQPQTEGNRQPAEQDWPTNGGPLGCLLGALAGFLLGGFLGTTLLIFERPIALALTVALTIGLAVAGWQIGRSIFREYKPPKPRRVKK